MFKRKLHWKRPLFFLLLPIFLVMIFLGFPMPVAPPPQIKAGQEQSSPVKKKRKKPIQLFRQTEKSDDDG
jgi:hypothetical protein